MTGRRLSRVDAVIGRDLSRTKTIALAMLLVASVIVLGVVWHRLGEIGAAGEAACKVVDCGK